MSGDPGGSLVRDGDPVLLTGRATEVLSAAADLVAGPGGTILLPALYCVEVAEAIEAKGCRVGNLGVRDDAAGRDVQCSRVYERLLAEHDQWTCRIEGQRDL